MSRFTFCNCPAGFNADPERHAPDCPGRSGAGKARTPVPATIKPAEQHQGEPVAQVRDDIERVSCVWSGQRPPHGANLYTRADPAEVERLRAQLEQFKIANARLSMSNVDRRNQNEELRAQLAERDALLDRVVDHAKFWRDHPYAEVVEAIAKDYKALSASAEPELNP